MQGGFTPPPGPPGGFLPPVPGGAVDDGRSPSASQVAAPAIALMVVSALSCLWYLFATVMVLFAGGISAFGGSRANLGDALGMGVASLVYLFFALAALVCFVGAYKMRKLESYTLSMVSAVLAILPCTTYVCCMLMMPFGIWALVVLMKPEVKAAFR
jgi:hypothetical protein